MKKYLLLLLGVLLMASCRSHKTAVDSTSGATAPDAVDHSAAALNRMVEAVNENRLQVDALTSRLSLRLAAGDKSVSVGGSLRMKRDDVIQMTLVMLGLMEVGRLELTPDYFMLVNRMERQYVKAAYSDIDFCRRNGIDFYTFQSLFCAELFAPGSRGEAPGAEQFRKTLDAGTLRLVNDEARQMVLTFLSDVATGMVRSTSFAGKDAPDRTVLSWQYEDYTKFERRQFPSRMQVSIAATSRPLSATISLSNVKASSDWETRTEVSKKYTQISIETALNSLMKLAK